MGAIFQADVYCDECADSIKPDGKGYDSDSYPYYCDIENQECDTPQHCASCHEFLGNPLTSYGEDYVVEAVNDDLRAGRMDSVAITEWMPYYDLSYLEPCSHCGEYSDSLEDDKCEDCIDSPCDGDFTLTPCGPLGSKTSVGRVNDKFVGEFDSDDEALVAINAIMEKERFWPNVWNVSDHGNWSLI